jgi:hypothetical protein
MRSIYFQCWGWDSRFTYAIGALHPELSSLALRSSFNIAAQIRKFSIKGIQWLPRHHTAGKQRSWALSNKSVLLPLGHKAGLEFTALCLLYCSVHIKF